MLQPSLVLFLMIKTLYSQFQPRFTWKIMAVKVLCVFMFLAIITTFSALIFCLFVVFVLSLWQ